MSFGKAGVVPMRGTNSAFSPLMLRRANALFISLAAAITLTLAAGLALRVEWLRRIESAAADRVAVLGRKAAVQPSLVFLAVDEASRLDPELDVADLSAGGTVAERRALELMGAGQWPWSREIYALAIERLTAAGASCVAIDLSFRNPGAGDAEFRRALEKHADRVVVTVHLGQTGNGAEAFMPPSGTLVTPQLRAQGILGFDNCWTGVDQVIRRAAFRITNPDCESLVARALQKSGFGNMIPDGAESHRLRFAGPPGRFSARPIYEIFAPEYWRLNFQNGEFFRGKIVLIGKSGKWIQDDHLTPMGLMEGPEIHLNIANAVLAREFLRETTPWEDALIVFSMGLAAVLLASLVRRPLIRLGILAVVAGGWLAVVLALFNHASLVAPAITPVAAWILVGGTGLFVDVLRERREKARVRSTLDRYVSSGVVKELLGDRSALNATLGGSVREITVLFTDIRSFTHLAANTEPGRLVAQLNDYFTAMVRCVFEHGGTLDKFMGDAVMAVWGNVRSKSPAEDACAAVRCALAMRTALAALNQRWQHEGFTTLDIGIALNHGAAVCGNIGAPNRMEFTAIGHHVNVAWRIQERTKQHPGEVLVGEAMLPLIASEFGTEPAGTVRVVDGFETGYSRVVIKSGAATGSRAA